MKRNALVLALALVVGLGGAARKAQAQECAYGPRPVITLLLPYFEVDLSKLKRPKRGETTTVHITNYAPVEALVHVTFWTDLQLPSYAWDMPIPAFGTLKLPLHKVFDGTIPGDEITGIAPPDADLSEIGAVHSGQPTEKRFAGACAARDYGDNVARGYITFDFVTNGVAREEGTGLIGDVVVDNRAKKYSQIDALIHVNLGSRLPTAWSARFDTKGGSDTELIVWRNIDHLTSQPYTCGSPEEHPWSALTQTRVAAYDDAGNMTEILLDGGGAPIPGFPNSAGRYVLGVGDLALPYTSGTLHLDLTTQDNSKASSIVLVRQTVASGKRRGTSLAGYVDADCTNPLMRRRSAPR